MVLRDPESRAEPDLAAVVLDALLVAETGRTPDGRPLEEQREQFVAVVRRVQVALREVDRAHFDAQVEIAKGTAKTAAIVEAIAKGFGRR